LGISVGASTTLGVLGGREGLVVRDKEVFVKVGPVKGRKRDERREKRIHQREHAERYRCV
jgi:hypothetical protein